MKVDMGSSLENLGIPKIEFNDFIELIMRNIPNRESPEVKARMLSIESHPQIGGNSMEVKCIKSNCRLQASYLIKYRRISIPEPFCSQHIAKLVIQLESKSWVHFGNDPIEVENYTIIYDLWPGLVRARIRQIKNFANL